MPLLKSEDGMKQILPSKLWISSGRKKTKTAILIIVPAVLWHGTMRDALTTKDLSGKFLHKTSGKNILDFEISELEDSKR